MRKGVFLLLSEGVKIIVFGIAFIVASIWLAIEAFWKLAHDNPGMAVVIVVSGVWLIRRVSRQMHEEALAKQAMLEARLRDEHVPDMSPLEYERFTARQLERAGWKVLHCGRPGDQGCDVLAELRGFRAVVQCKLYRKACGNQGVQEVVATRRHYNAQIMAVVCPAGFTKSAQELAASNGVHLLHHNELGSLERAARIS